MYFSLCQLQYQHSQTLWAAVHVIVMAVDRVKGGKEYKKANIPMYIHIRKNYSKIH